MSPDEPLPHALPAGARQAFASEDAARRFAKVAQLQPGARVLLLGGAHAAALLLAREYGCHVVAADEDPEALEALRDAAEAQGLDSRLEVHPLEGVLQALEPGSLQAILARGARVYRTREAAERLRPLLAADGRIGLLGLARVGRSQDAEALAVWEAAQRAPVLAPLALLAELRDAGYEPEAVETLVPAELEALVAALEPEEASREELGLWREQAGGGGVAYALVTGRRREPNERPPAPHDRG